jgi:hypothetical protein
MLRMDELVERLKAGAYIIVSYNDDFDPEYVLTNIGSDGKNTVLMLWDWFVSFEYSSRRNVHDGIVTGKGPWRVGDYYIREVGPKEEANRPKVVKYLDTQIAKQDSKYDFDKAQARVLEFFPI